MCVCGVVCVCDVFVCGVVCIWCVGLCGARVRGMGVV